MSLKSKSLGAPLRVCSNGELLQFHKHRSGIYRGFIGELAAKRIQEGKVVARRPVRVMVRSSR